DNGNAESPERMERREQRDNNAAVQPSDRRGNQETEAAPPAGRSGHQQSPGFADMTVSQQAKRYVHIASLLLIFGSYLYLRQRKARRKKRE
ncbi:MAG: hypothetical protein LBB62_04635, partial [Proteiniphilum sp.]|nr:hypothetical protein [Proteiniphilum sp.]